MRTALLLLLLLTNGDVRDELTGQWVGTSLCTEPRGACRDETASYRFAKHRDPDKVTASLNKIVNGEEEVMGVEVFTVDGKARTARCDFDNRHGRHSFQLHWEGNRMTGALVRLSDGRVLRNIALTRR